MPSHRGCIRIVMLVASGPDELGQAPLRPCRFLHLTSPRTRLAAGASRLPCSANLSGRLVPSGGWAGSGGAHPNAWRFQEVRSFRPDRCPFQAAGPAFPASACRSALAAEAVSGHCESSSGAAFEPPDDCAPLAASAVRQVLSEDFARRVFRRCCGHRSHLERVELYLSFSGG